MKLVALTIATSCLILFVNAEVGVEIAKFTYFP